jgi:hypothetical protein
VILAALLLLSDPLAPQRFPAAVAGTYAQTRPDASCTLTVDAKGAYALACGSAPPLAGRLRAAGSFLTPQADSPDWQEYETAALAHLAEERKDRGHVPDVARRPPQAPVTFLLTAVVRDGRTFLVDFAARRGFCGEDTPGAGKADDARVFRKQDDRRPFGTPSADYCADGWQPSL